MKELPVPGYHDLYFRISLSLLGAHFIIAFGEPESFFQLLLMWDYYRSLLSSFVIAFLLISFINKVSTRLDSRYDWYQRTAIRVAMQTLWGVAVPAVLAFLLAAVYFHLHGMHILKTEYVTFDFPMIVLMLVMLNMYYLVYYLLRRSPAAPGKEEPGTTYRNTFIVSKGVRRIPVPIEDIAYFFHEGEYNFLRTFKGEDFLVSNSLEEAQLQVDPAVFFRANRQMLVSFKACNHFEPFEHGKLLLVVEPPYKRLIPISQKRVKEFKIWMEK